MPLEISCPSCSGQFRVPDSAAGKKIRCPKCKGAIEVPAAKPAGSGDVSPRTSAPSEVFVPPPAARLDTKPAAKPDPVFVPPPAAKSPSVSPLPPIPPPAAKPLPPADEWSLQTAEGEEYGPVPRDELDGWFQEGRITADCQVRSGDGEWQPAPEVYEQLREPPMPGGGDRGSRVEDRNEDEIAPQPAVQPKPGKNKTTTKVATADVDRSQRSRLVAGFLGIFLGPLGIHRFYLGYWGVGLAMLFTGGGCGFWSLIDSVFVMVGRVPDADGSPLSD